MNYAITKRSYVSLPAHLAHAALVIFVVVNSPGTASCAIILQKSAGTPLPQGNLVQYTISAVGTAGESIASFNTPTITPIGASLGIHNVAQAFTNAGTPTKAEHARGLWNSDWAAYDTFFLFDSTEAISLGPNFTETSNGATTGTLGLSPIPTVPRSGFGIYGSDAIGSKRLLHPAQSSNVAFMQVVLRAVDTARLEVFAMGDGSCGGCFPQEILIGPFIVPEPTTIALLAVAMIGLLTSYRRERRPCAVTSRLLKSINPIGAINA